MNRRVTRPHAHLGAGRYSRLTIPFATIVLAVAWSPPAASAQPVGADGAADARPVYAATVGFGNTLGWLGGGVERYVQAGRTSVAVGVGYLPEIESGQPTTAAFAAAVRRAYTSMRVWAWAGRSGSEPCGRSGRWHWDTPGAVEP